MDSRKKIWVSKIEVARRQLDCAIELWFHDGDEISIHTLAAAAYQIIHDTCQKKGISGQLIYDSKFIKDEARDLWVSTIKKPVNFFKHADRDADTSLEFATFGSLVFLMSSALGIELLGLKNSENTTALFYWLTLHVPELIHEEAIDRYVNVMGVEQLESIRSIKKSEFLEVVKDGHRKLGRTF